MAPFTFTKAATVPASSAPSYATGKATCGNRPPEATTNVRHIGKVFLILSPSGKHMRGRRLFRRGNQWASRYGSPPGNVNMIVAARSHRRGQHLLHQSPLPASNASMSCRFYLSGLQRRCSALQRFDRTWCYTSPGRFVVVRPVSFSQLLTRR